MTLNEIMAAGIEPALAWLPSKMTSDGAKVMLLAIGLQESRFEHRWQVLNGTTSKGPARSFWQAEEHGGMVEGVMTHPATAALARAAAADQFVSFTTRAMWLAIEDNDKLAAVLARLLLWTDPGSLPAPTDEAGAWALYLRVWRPGAYSRGDADTRAALRLKWARNHKAARAFLGFP